MQQRTESNVVSIESMPSEILFKIFSYLSLKDLATLTLVNSAIKLVANGKIVHTQSFYEKKYQRVFPELIENLKANKKGKNIDWKQEFNKEYKDRLSSLSLETRKLHMIVRKANIEEFKQALGITSEGDADNKKNIVEAFLELRDNKENLLWEYVAKYSSQDFKDILFQEIITNKPYDNGYIIPNSYNTLAFSKDELAVIFNQKQCKGLNKKNIDDNCLLHLASQYGHNELVNSFLQKQANVKAKDFNRNTPLHLAAAYGHADAIEALINHKAKVDEKNDEGDTPLHFAARSGYVAAINALINRKANVNEKNRYGYTPLHLAAAYGHADAIEALINHKAKVDEKNNNGDTPLHFAAMDNQIDAINALIKHQAKVDEKNDEGDTPLHFAAMCNQIDAINALIKHKAKVDEKNYEGDTPLHFAAMYNQIDAINALIKHQAKVDEKNGAGETPLDLAQSSGKDISIQVISLLSSTKAEMSLGNNNLEQNEETSNQSVPNINNQSPRSGKGTKRNRNSDEALSNSEEENPKRRKVGENSNTFYQSAETKKRNLEAKQAQKTSNNFEQESEETQENKRRRLD